MSLVVRVYHVAEILSTATTATAAVPADRTRLTLPLSHDKLSGPEEYLSDIPRLEDLAIPMVSSIKPGPVDLIPGFLPRNGQLVLAGETDIGKSLIAIETASALTMDAPLWGKLVPTVKAKRILYVLGEHYVEVLQRLYQKTGLPMSDQVWLLGPEKLKGDKWLVMGGKPNQPAVDKFMRWAEGSDLIIWDPLSAFICGIDAENDNLQMRLVLDTMSLIAQSAGASCLVLAHQGKPFIDQTGREHHKRSYAIRGASAIEDAATNIFYMSAVRGEGQTGGKLEEDGVKLLELTRRKYKGEAPESYKLARNPENLTHNLLTSNRPLLEQARVATEIKVSRFLSQYPEKTVVDAVRMIALIEGKDEITIKRHLGLK